MSFLGLSEAEITRVIGIRATQISQGAKIFVNHTDGEIFDPLKIAKQEFECGKIPIKIIRTMPNGDKQVIRFVAKKE